MRTNRKKKKIVISTSSFGKFDKKPLMQLEQSGLEVVMNPHGRKVTPEELLEIAGNAVGLIAGTENLSASVLERLTHLKIISRCGVGLDSVDLNAAERFGKKVYITPHGPTLAVAELTVGTILSMLRCVHRMDRQIRDSVWQKRMGNLLFGKKVGIIGMGRIGSKVAQLLQPFEVKIGFCDQVVGNFLKCTKMKLMDLLSWADIISLHIPAEPGCRPCIGVRELAHMKPGGWVINYSRGGLIDEDALAESLIGGHLAGAALDVFDQEPYRGPLTKIENVVLTPHIGSYAREGRINMEREAVANLLAGLHECSILDECDD